MQPSPPAGSTARPERTSGNPAEAPPRVGAAAEDPDLAAHPDLAALVDAFSFSFRNISARPDTDFLSSVRPNNIFISVAPDVRFTRSDQPRRPRTENP